MMSCIHVAACCLSAAAALQYTHPETHDSTLKVGVLGQVPASSSVVEESNPTALHVNTLERSFHVQEQGSDAVVQFRDERLIGDMLAMFCTGSPEDTVRPGCTLWTAISQIPAAAVGLSTSVKQQTRLFQIKSNTFDNIPIVRPRQFNQGLLPFADGRWPNQRAQSMLNDWAYWHMLKNGGTTVHTQIGAEPGSGFKSMEQMRGKPWLTFVRDPVDHFISGWQECLGRDQRDESDPRPEIDPVERELLLRFAQNLESFVKHWDILSKKAGCTVHSWPQIKYIIGNTSTGHQKIYPEVQAVFQLEDMEWFFEHVWARDEQYSGPSRVGRNGSYSLEVNSTDLLLDICGIVWPDYCAWAFEPPDPCRSMIQESCGNVSGMKEEDHDDLFGDTARQTSEHNEFQSEAEPQASSKNDFDAPVEMEALGRQAVVPTGDWIFMMHHKTGTLLANMMSTKLCNLTGRTWIKYTFRERPKTCSTTYCCHFLIKAYPEDLKIWLSHLQSRAGRLVHFVRNPVDMVASAYSYHRSGAEDHWTNSTRCSRDLCVLPDRKGVGLSEKESESFFEKMDAKPWLASYGCEQYSTYLECLRSKSEKEGLLIETSRSYETIANSLSIAERLRSSSSAAQTQSLCLDQFAAESFNRTLVDMIRWLGVSDYGAATSVYEAVFVDFDNQQLMSAHSTHSKDKIEFKHFRTRGGPPKLRELSARSHCAASYVGNHEAKVQPLFREEYQQFRTDGTRGIVMCSAPQHVKSIAHTLQRVRLAGCGLPVQVWHLGELNQPHIDELTKEQGVRVLDLLDVLSPLPSDELELMRGYMCKPLALLASSFTEVLSIDHDAWVFMNTTSLFNTTQYLSSGMLLFRDRVQMKTPSLQKDAGRFLRSFIQRRIDILDFLPISFTTSVAQWNPPSSLIEAPIFNSESNHHIDSSILLLDKARAVDVVLALYVLHDKYRYELYNNLHGDKETFWLACEFVGKCGVSPYLPGVMGDPQEDQCLRGNLFQFHPDKPELGVHCNCKPEAIWYTHVSDIPRHTASQLQQIKRNLLDTYPLGTERELLGEVEPPFQSCASTWESQLVKKFMVRQLSLGESFDDNLCESNGTMCTARGRCEASPECLLSNPALG